MFKPTLTAIVLAVAVVNPVHADPSLFEQGRQDRAAWEQWFNGLQGDYKTGAFFWSSQRSLSNPGSCKQVDDDFYAGCTAAKTRLSASDTRRKTEPDYKAGWNAWTPSGMTTSASAAAPAPTTAPTPAQTLTRDSCQALRATVEARAQYNIASPSEATDRATLQRCGALANGDLNNSPARPEWHARLTQKNAALTDSLPTNGIARGLQHCPSSEFLRQRAS